MRKFGVFGVLIIIIALVTTLGWAQTTIKLPNPSLDGKMSVEKAMAKKKSVRAFSAAVLNKFEISQMLWSANGNIPLDAISSATTKVLPSAGALYPIEIFLVVGSNTVEDIPAGTYQYDPSNNSLKPLASGDVRLALAQAALSQVWLARAPAILIIGAVFSRTTAKYGNRGVQYVFMEAGNSNQNIYLQGEALGLKIATVGAFNEAQVSSVLKLPSEVTPLLLIGVGK